MRIRVLDLQLFCSNQPEATQVGFLAFLIIMPLAFIIHKTLILRKIIGEE
ncbi:MAG: hypothetical protein Q7S60_04740 [bacterium]|nr:hypothetical protein [bacterium]